MKHESQDLITFSCPSCGGRLESQGSKHDLLCVYCDRRHQVINPRENSAFKRRKDKKFERKRPDPSPRNLRRLSTDFLRKDLWRLKHFSTRMTTFTMLICISVFANVAQLPAYKSDGFKRLARSCLRKDAINGAALKRKNN